MNAPMNAACEESPGYWLQNEPGNGTVYLIHVVEHRYGGWIWTWMPETTLAACGWASERKGGEVRNSGRTRISKIDLEEIKKLLDLVRP